MADQTQAVAHQNASTGEFTTGDPNGGADQSSDSKQPLLDIKIFAPFHVYFEGKGLSLSALNKTGPFDVLPQHYNFLCMLLPCNVVIKTPYDTKTVKIGRALMHVRSDKVTIFVDV